jgi:PKD repeat protein
MKNIYRSTVIAIGLVVASASSNGLFAQNVNIPDANFKAALVANASINTNSDSEIQVSEASVYAGAITVGTMGITDLTGIEAFPAVTVLDVSQNALSSIDLSANFGLKNFYCSYNSITCLDLSNNINLLYLDCSSAGIQKLNVKNANNVNITYFNSTGNPGLTCIQVDNVAYSSTSWPNHDGSSSFSTDCGIPVAGFTSNAPVCFGTPITFTNTSTNSTSWSWNFGDGGNSPLQNPNYTYAATGGYTVSLTARSCYGTSYYSTNVYEGQNLFGHVGYTGGDVTNGVVLLYPYQPFYTSFDTAGIQSIFGAGIYYFSNIPDGDYLVKVFPDTFAYPALIPTYFNNDWAWDSASVITHGCTTATTADITMVEMVAGGGPGLLQGVVIEGMGFGRAPGDPVHGVDIKLGLTASSTIVDCTTTDALGGYSFDNVAYGSYTIYADIPGLERDSSYTLVVDSLNNQFLGLDYLVDSTTIYVLLGMGVDDISPDPNRLNVYPNPVTVNSTIEYVLGSNANVKLDVYNLLGVKVQSFVNTQQESGTYQYNFNPQSNALKPGVYFISLSVNGKISTRRMIVME